MKNIYINQAESYSKDFIAIQGNDFIDLTSAEISGWLKKSYESIYGVQFTIEKIDPINGAYRLSLDESQTTSLDSAKIYVYDVVATIGQDNIRLASGNAYIARAVTVPDNIEQVPLPNYRFDILGYPEATEISDTDYLLISSNGAMKKVRISKLVELINGGVV